MDYLYKLFVILLISSTALFSQNVGINTNTPTRTLDVNGDINVAGDLSANGVSGQSGDLLMSNGDGTITWATYACNYKNFITYARDGAESFTIPNDVYEVMIEMWGGGGSGAQGGGGGSGAYISAILKVNPADKISFTIGSGGTSSSSATISQFLYNGTSYIAGAGFNASTGASGFGGNVIYINGGAPKAIARPGCNGASTIVKYSQINSSDYVVEYNYGDGGSAPFSQDIGKGAGGYRSMLNGATVLESYEGRPGQSGGNGGGGSVLVKNGGDGMVIIRW